MCALYCSYKVREQFAYQMCICVDRIVKDAAPSAYSSRYKPKFVSFLHEHKGMCTSHVDTFVACSSHIFDKMIYHTPSMYCIWTAQCDHSAHICIWLKDELMLRIVIHLWRYRNAHFLNSMEGSIECPFTFSEMISD